MITVQALIRCANQISHQVDKNDHCEAALQTNMFYGSNVSPRESVRVICHVTILLICYDTFFVFLLLVGRSDSRHY